MLSKASSTLQNIPPRFCRGRGLPAPSPAKQAGRASSRGTDMGSGGSRGSPHRRPPPGAGPGALSSRLAPGSATKCTKSGAGPPPPRPRCPRRATAQPGKGTGKAGSAAPPAPHPRPTGAAGPALGLGEGSVPPGGVSLPGTVTASLPTARPLRIAGRRVAFIPAAAGEEVPGKPSGGLAVLRGDEKKARDRLLSRDFQTRWKEEILDTEGGKSLAQVAQRGGRCPMPETTAGQAVCGCEQPALVADIPADGRRVGVDDL